jgi:phosphoenolpyruvate phosphomutase
MRQTAMQIYDLQSLHEVEDRIATLAEVFELQNADELQQAEKRYLPPTAGHSK